MKNIGTNIREAGQDRSLIREYLEVQFRRRVNRNSSGAQHRNGTKVSFVDESERIRHIIRGVHMLSRVDA